MAEKPTGVNEGLLTLEDVSGLPKAFKYSKRKRRFLSGEV
jgi:hypothetical protein